MANSSRFPSEIQQILIEHGLSPSSAFATQYLESHLTSQLLSLLHRLRSLVRSSYSQSLAPPPPFTQLLLLLLKNDPVLHYRLSLYLAFEDARRRGRESAYGHSELEAPSSSTTQAGSSSSSHAAQSEEHASAATAINSNNTPSVGAGATSRPAPEDAWDHPEPVSDNLSYLYTTNAHLRPIIQHDVLSLYEEYASPLSEEEKELRIKRRRTDKGWKEHMRRMEEYDERAKKVQVGEYVQLGEGRMQAGFTGSSSSSSSSSSMSASGNSKARSSKRFKDYIGPHLAALDILPSAPNSATTSSSGSSENSQAQDELIDALAFLSKEIIIRLLEAGREVARARIGRSTAALELQKDKEDAATKAKAKSVTHNGSGGASKSRKRKLLGLESGVIEESAEAISSKSVDGDAKSAATASANVAVSGANKGKSTADKSQKAASNTSKVTAEQVKQEEELRLSKEKERRIAELNSRPTGPFSGPSSSSSAAAAAAGGAMPSHSRSASTKDLTSAANDDPTASTPTPTTGGASANQLESGHVKESATITTAAAPAASAGVGAEKRDPVVGSDIISPLDVLLGDYEAAALTLPVIGTTGQELPFRGARSKQTASAGKGFAGLGGFQRAWRSAGVRAR